MKHVSPPDSAEGHVLVIGAGMTGLLFGKVLSEVAERVSILDHDELPTGPEFRRGAGQMRHTHMMLDRGREIYEQLFPGAVEECCGPGTGPFDASAEFRWHQFGMWKPTPDVDVDMWPTDRTRFEWAVRRRLQEQGNVEFVPGRKAVDFVFDEEETAVRGAVFETDNGTNETWPAQLVVDAMGRGTRTPGLLEDHGFGPLPDQAYEAGVSYTTGEVHEPSDYGHNWRLLYIMPGSFDSPRLGVIYRLNEDEYRVTLGGWSGVRAPTDESGFRDFARDLAHPALHEILEHTEFSSDLRRFRVPRMQFRRYDEMDDRPDGLLVAGDAFCNFNPVFGQGMTVAAREAIALRDLIGRDRESAAVVAPSTLDAYYDRAASLISESWVMTAALDCQFPGVEVEERLPRLLAPFVENLHRSSCRSSAVHETVTRLIHMQGEPTAVLRPSVLAGLSGTALRRMVGFDG